MTTETLAPTLRTKSLPPEERATVEYSGPHRWQVASWARLIRRWRRHDAYTRHFEEAITDFDVSGLEHLESLHGPAIFAPNHTSHLDTIVFQAALPAPFCDDIYYGAAADRWFRKGQKKLILKPWYQSLVLGTFPIVRGGGSKTLDHARWLLRGGHSLCIFPEGTRAMSDQLGRFRHGVSILALDEGVPIVPVYLSGLRKLRPKGAREVRPGPAGVEFLAPLEFAPGTPVSDATDALWQVMQAQHALRWPDEAVYDIAA